MQSRFLLLVAVLMGVSVLSTEVVKGDTVGIYKCTEVRTVRVWGVTDANDATAARPLQRVRRTFFLVRSIEQPSLPIVVFDYGVEAGTRFYEQSNDALEGALNIFCSSRRVFQGIDDSESFSFNADSAGGNDSFYLDTLYLKGRLSRLRIPRVGIDFQYVPKVLTSRFRMSEDRTRVEIENGGYANGKEYWHGNASVRWTLLGSLTTRANDDSNGNLNGQVPGTLGFGAEIVKQFLEGNNYEQR